jgi:hypothetical protein
MEKMLNEGNQIQNFISSSGCDFNNGSGSGSTSQKVTVPTVPTVPVPVPVPQRCPILSKIFEYSENKKSYLSCISGHMKH